MPKPEDLDAAHLAWSAGYKHAMLADDPRVELLRQGFTKDQIENNSLAGSQEVGSHRRTNASTKPPRGVALRGKQQEEDAPTVGGIVEGQPRIIFE